MGTWTAIFIALTGVAVALQAGVLLAMYFAMRKSSERFEALATAVQVKALPTMELVQTVLTEMQPKLEVISDNLEATTTLLRSQLERVDATVTDAVDRARLQVIRGDELLSRTLDRVELTSDLVHNTVISPVRQLSGLMQGITAGIEFILGNRRRRNGGGEAKRPVPQDEMFI